MKTPSLLLSAIVGLGSAHFTGASPRKMDLSLDSGKPLYELVMNHKNRKIGHMPDGGTLYRVTDDKCDFILIDNAPFGEYGINDSLTIRDGELGNNKRGYKSGMYDENLDWFGGKVYGAQGEGDTTWGKPKPIGKYRSLLLKSQKKPTLFP